MIKVRATKRDRFDRLVSAKCDCGKWVYIDGFTNECECGLLYNQAGQQLAPMSEWGKETGESLVEIFNEV